MTLSPVKPDLKGRRIVAYDDGATDWSTADPGTVPPGRLPRYGLLPVLVESLGGEFIRSRDLADADLQRRRRAHRLAAPIGRQCRMRRPRRRFPAISKTGFGAMSPAGGRMIVAGDPETNLGVEENALNALLQPTAMSFRDDTANSLTRALGRQSPVGAPCRNGQQQPGAKPLQPRSRGFHPRGVARRAAVRGTLGLGRIGHRSRPARGLALFAGQSPGRPGPCGPAERGPGNGGGAGRCRLLEQRRDSFFLHLHRPAALGVGRQPSDAAGLVAAVVGRGGRGRGDRAPVSPLRSRCARGRGGASPWRWP